MLGFFDKKRRIFMKKDVPTIGVWMFPKTHREFDSFTCCQ